MATEAPPPIDLSRLSVKDLARLARDEIQKFANPVERAMVNLELIDRIRQTPSIKAYLENTATSIEILSTGSFDVSKSLSVTPEGLSLRWYQKTARRTGFWQTSLLDVDRDGLAQFYDDNTSGYYSNRDFVLRLAKLKPMQIIKKFEKAVSTPIKVA